MIAWTMYFFPRPFESGIFGNEWILYVLIKVGVEVGAVIDTDTETDKL